MGQFGEKVTVSDVDFKMGTLIVFDILPYFALSDTLKVYVSGGLQITLPDQGDNVIGWHINPYLSKAVGTGAFLLGFRIDSDGIKDASGDKTINWKIPVAVSYSF